MLPPIPHRQYVFTIPKMLRAYFRKDRRYAKALLNRMVEEMEKRYESMLALEARNIQEFNETIRKHRRTEFVKFNGK